MSEPAPALSMLWEPDDPAQALTERFGFADGRAVVGWLAEALHEHWDLPLQRCDRVVVSSWNALAWVTADDTRVIVKWCALPTVFAHLGEVATLTAWLSGHSIPVAAPLASNDNRLQVECGVDRRLSLCVLPVVGGALLDVGDPAQVQEAGRMLALVHKTLAAYPRHFGSGPSAKGDQLLHGDFRSANLLHDGTQITAVLDWERVSYGTRVADLAQAAVLLGTRYHDWAPTDDEVQGRFIDAYSEVTPLTDTQVGELGRCIEAVHREMGWMRGT